MIGARQAGWDEVVGVEISNHYADIARERLAEGIGML
jgi:DNA modification methylase